MITFNNSTRQFSVKHIKVDYNSRVYDGNDLRDNIHNQKATLKNINSLRHQYRNEMMDLDDKLSDAEDYVHVTRMTHSSNIRAVNELIKKRDQANKNYQKSKDPHELLYIDQLNKDINRLNKNNAKLRSDYTKDKNTIKGLKKDYNSYKDTISKQDERYKNIVDELGNNVNKKSHIDRSIRLMDQYNHNKRKHINSITNKAIIGGGIIGSGTGYYLAKKLTKNKKNLKRNKFIGSTLGAATGASLTGLIANQGMKHYYKKYQHG